jgi:hypothetical protein
MLHAMGLADFSFFIPDELKEMGAWTGDETRKGTQCTEVISVPCVPFLWASDT